MPKNSKTAFREAINELSRGFDVRYVDHCQDLYVGISSDTSTYYFDFGTGHVILQRSNKSGYISIAIKQNKGDDKPITVRYITEDTYKENKAALDQVVEIIINAVYLGNDIDNVIENVNALLPEKRSFAQTFAEELADIFFNQD